MTETPTAVVARRVRALRQGKFTAEELAGAMRANGIAWQRTVVAKLENGRRESVSVDELFALALVLGVTPAELLVDLAADSAPVVADVDVLPAELLLWVLSETELPEPAPVTSTGPDLAAVRRLWRAWNAVRIGENRYAVDDPAVDDLDVRRSSLRAAVADVRRRGIRAPSVVEDYLARFPEIGQ